VKGARVRGGYVNNGCLVRWRGARHMPRDHVMCASRARRHEGGGAWGAAGCRGVGGAAISVRVRTYIHTYSCLFVCHVSSRPGVAGACLVGFRGFGWPFLGGGRGRPLVVGGGCNVSPE